MKVSISKGSLVAVLTRCAAAAKPKSPSPVLSCVRLEASGKSLKAQATDLFQDVSTVALDVAVTSPGAIAVACRDLLDRVKSLPEGLVSLELKSDKLIVTSGKRKHTVPAMPASDFPEIVAVKADGTSVPVGVLAALIDRTDFAMCDQPNRANIHGLMLAFGDGELRASATDGSRLSTASAPVSVARKGTPMLLPHEAVKALRGLLGGEGDAFVSTDGTRVFVVLESLTFTSKLVAQTFPSLDAFFAIKQQRKFIAPKAMLLDSLSSVEKASADGAKKGLLKLTLGADSLRVTAEGKGAAVDDVDIVYDGPEMTFWAYYRLLADAISACPSDEVEVGTGGELDPIFIRPVDDASVVGLVMPSMGN